VARHDLDAIEPRLYQSARGLAPLVNSAIALAVAGSVVRIFQALAALAFIGFLLIVAVEAMKTPRVRQAHPITTHTS
jgi:hypothetical protein